jgi:hypothetical protein
MIGGKRVNNPIENVSFNFIWKEKDNSFCKGFVKFFNINLGHSSKIRAIFDNVHKTNKEQHLNFEICTQNNIYKANTLFCPIKLAKRINITAEILKKDVEEDQTEEFPVCLMNLPDFTAGTLYNIEVLTYGTQLIVYLKAQPDNTLIAPTPQQEECSKNPNFFRGLIYLFSAKPEKPQNSLLSLEKKLNPAKILKEKLNAGEIPPHLILVARRLDELNEKVKVFT